MSATGVRPAGHDPKQELATTRSPIAHLLHALNQPLTGLQCSLELASVGVRPQAEYAQTLRESLQLVSRMRVLVEALRELVDSSEPALRNVGTFQLDDLVREITDDLLPVAESQGSKICVQIGAPIPVRADRRRLAAHMFRFVESALSMTRVGASLEIEGRALGNQACVSVSWQKGDDLSLSPFSHPELGLQVARAGWEREGATWTECCQENTQTCTVHLPLALTNDSNPLIGGLR